MKTQLSEYNIDWYKPGSRIKKLTWYFINVLFFINPLIPLSGLKCFLLRLFGAKVGKGVIIKPAVNIKYPWMLEIGDYTWIGEDVWIDNLAQVTIGSNVCISQGTMLLTGNHNYKKSTFDLMIAGIILEDGVWIGAKSVVCPSVTCFSHAVLAVASVATKNLGAYTINQGNPAVCVNTRKIMEN